MQEVSSSRHRGGSDDERSKLRVIDRGTRYDVSGNSADWYARLRAERCSRAM